MNTKKIAITSVMLAFVLIIGLVESYFPPIVPVLPTLKLGLSNVIIMCSLLLLGFWQSLIIMVLKCIILSIIIGNMSALIYSLPAGVVSFLVVTFLLKSGIFGFAAVSATAAAVHNIIQIFVACIVMKSSVPLIYLPYLTLFGMLTGVITGLICFYLLKKLPDKFYVRDNLQK